MVVGYPNAKFGKVVSEYNIFILIHVHKKYPVNCIISNIANQLNNFSHITGTIFSIFAAVARSAS